MNILVVDDEMFLADALCDFLKQEGYQCEAKGSGQEALHLMAEERPEVVITDFNMPGMTGIELLEQIKKGHPETKVLILTGFADVDNAIEAVNYGATAYFRKPLNREKLLETLKTIAHQIALEKKAFFHQESLKKECSRLRSSLQTLEHMLSQYKKDKELQC